MLFNSIAFLLFFPIVCIVYYAIPVVKYRNLFLLMASYWFYMNWKPVYALLLLTSTIITWIAANGISHFSDKSKKKRVLTVGIILNLAILFLFKYYDFAAAEISSMLRAAGLGVTMPEFALLLPVGISFYIFQALGYSIDVYRDKVKVEKDFFTYALFVSFFPQLVAGPIERSTNLLPQFRTKHKFDYDRTMVGIRWMVWGYFLKLVLADRCGIYVDAIFNNIANHNGGSMLVASLLFPFQVYGDFAGYSLIAIGASRIMGFYLMDNFRRPYFSTSITEFWHRWHISLSTWFKDYVYIPLGGNRAGSVRTYFNLLATFAISGLWHGANWTFLLWGLWHGFAICVERATGIAKLKSSWGGLFRWILTLFVVWFGWILFRANSICDAALAIKTMITDFGAPFLTGRQLLTIASLVMIVFVKEAKDEFGWKIYIADSPFWIVRHLYIALMILFIVAFGVLNGSQFLYFQF